MKKLLLSLIVLTLISCGGGKGNNDTPIISKMDIIDAKNLFIADSSTASTSNVETASVSNGTTLFQITEEGYIEEVTYYDEYNNPITNIMLPTYVENLNDSFIVVIFQENSYLVRKSDGVTYLINNEEDYTFSIENGSGDLSKNVFKNQSQILASDNNIYYPTYYGNNIRIVKLSNISNSPTRKYYTPETDNVSNYSVDDNDNMIYTYSGVRLKRSNGSLENLPNYTSFWKANDGNLYYNAHSSTEIINAVTGSAYGTITEPVNINSSDFIIYINGKTLITDEDKIYEVYNNTATPNVIDMSSYFNSIDVVTYSDNYYYLAGKDNSNSPRLMKCNSSHSCSDIISVGSYEIYKMVVDSNDTLTFNALKMSNSAKIIGKYTETNGIEIIEENLNNEVEYLIQVN